MAAKAREALPEGSCHVIAAEVHVEFLFQGCNKATALEAVLKEWNLEWESVAFFGDNNNVHFIFIKSRMQSRLIWVCLNRMWRLLKQRGRRTRCRMVGIQLRRQHKGCAARRTSRVGSGWKFVLCWVQERLWHVLAGLVGD